MANIVKDDWRRAVPTAHSAPRQLSPSVNQAGGQAYSWFLVCISITTLTETPVEEHKNCPKSVHKINKKNI